MPHWIDLTEKLLGQMFVLEDIDFFFFDHDVCGGVFGGRPESDCVSDHNRADREVVVVQCVRARHDECSVGGQGGVLMKNTVRKMNSDSSQS